MTYTIIWQDSEDNIFVTRAQGTPDRRDAWIALQRHSFDIIIALIPGDHPVMLKDDITTFST